MVVWIKLWGHWADKIHIPRNHIPKHTCCEIWRYKVLSRCRLLHNCLDLIGLGTKCGRALKSDCKIEEIYSATICCCCIYIITYTQGSSLSVLTKPEKVLDFLKRAILIEPEIDFPQDFVFCYWCFSTFKMFLEFKSIMDLWIIVVVHKWGYAALRVGIWWLVCEGHCESRVSGVFGCCVYVLKKIKTGSTQELI